MPKVEVSVCIASYNGLPYITEQVDSILAQLPSNSELIISDDGSSDGTLEYLKVLKEQDVRVKILEGPKRGIAHNFENALSQCRGELIFLSDQDDIWYPNRIEKAVQLHKDYDLVVVNADVIDSNGSKVGTTVYSEQDQFRSTFRILIKNQFVGCLMSFRRNLLISALPFPKKTPMHDWWLGILGKYKFTCYRDNSTVIGYRRHGSNFSDTLGKSRYTLKQKLIFRIILLIGLIKWKLIQVFCSTRT
ncbi:glycosyltransferase [Vibrio breoganii]